MRKIRLLSAALAAVLMVCLLASCTAGLGNPDAINDYVPDVMTWEDPETGGVFTFAYGEGDTAILVKYSGKITSGDHVTIPEFFDQKNSKKAAETGENSEEDAIVARRKVVAIGDHAFYHLASIVEVKIPDTVKTIGDFAFAECTELPAITLPDAVVSVGRFAFEGCTKLTDVKLDAALETIGEFAFANCTALESITLPENVTELGKAAFWGDVKLAAIEMPASVTKLGALCFYNCENLQSVKLTDNITEIGEFCFVTEKTSLKDKIDVSGLAKDGYVARYVAAMAEPTTEAETEAEEPAA